jgi:predicted  nucleic acid-binding Zn-ribbon protein
MKQNIKLLEDRVRRAAERLKEMSAERKGLERKVQTLQTRLESVEKKRSADETAAAASGEGSNGWPEQREEIVAALKETIAELRAD